MDHQVEITHLLTTEEAIAFVRKVDRTNAGSFCLSVRLDATIADDKDSCFRDGLSTYLPLSRKQALTLVKDMLSPALEARGGRITIREVSFPGSVGDTRPTFWIS
jgi:hypothetical protein